MAHSVFRPGRSGTIRNIFSASNEPTTPNSDLRISFKLATGQVFTAHAEIVDFGFLISGQQHATLSSEGWPGMGNVKLTRRWTQNPPRLVLTVTNPTPTKTKLLTRRKSFVSLAANRKESFANRNESFGSSNYKSDQALVSRLGTSDDRSSNVSTPPTEIFDSDTGKSPLFVECQNVHL